MSGTLRSRNRRDISEVNSTASTLKGLNMDETSSDLEIYAKEVLGVLIADNLPPTPNNFSLYFDRLLEDKSENLRKQIVSMLELEEGNSDENSMVLEQNLKQGFVSIKNILTVTANFYKNMSLMGKILEKRKQELGQHPEVQEVAAVIAALEGDVSKLSDIVKKQSSQMKTMYDETANIVKSVEHETVFDNQFGVYNRRYLLAKIEQEAEMIREFNHKSSLILIELSRDLASTIKNEKAIVLMTRTIARLLLKTSRRSDIVAYYGNGKFAMLLKHTDLESAKKASERLCDLVSNSNFFLSDREIQLKISIGITNIDQFYSVEEIVVSALEGIEKAYTKQNIDYAAVLRTNKDN